MAVGFADYNMSLAPTAFSGSLGRSGGGGGVETGGGVGGGGQLQDLTPNASISIASGWGVNATHHSGLAAESQVILVVLYTLTTMLAVVGNTLVIVVFTLGRRSRTDLRGFLINLAVADLIMSLFCMPFTFTMTMLRTWVFSDPMCPIVLYMQTVSVTASVCTNMAIGIDRFWVVTFPLKSRITKSRTKVVIALIWVVSCGLSSVQLAVGRAKTSAIIGDTVVRDCVEVWPEPSETLRRAYTFFLLSTTYLTPLLILSFTYGFVGIRLWQRSSPGNADEARDNQQLRSKRKVIKMLVVVVVLFGICWMPLHMFFLVLDLNPELTNYASAAEENLFTAVYCSVHWLAMSNSFVNPIIYGFLNDSFRMDLKRLCRLWFPCCQELPCLKQDLLSRESTYRAYLRHDSQVDNRRTSPQTRHDSSTASLRNSSESKRKLLNVKVNGCGRYETELSARETLITRQATEKANVPV